MSIKGQISTVLEFIDHFDTPGVYRREKDEADNSLIV